ncbi:MAG: DNA alkylation repair protein [Candidatus Aminicenantes bacterium]|nr:DNA alkylation repair protein [Candidatus Aminicenantes bacterium]
MRESLPTELRRTFANAAGGRQPQPERKYHKDDAYLCYGLKTAIFDDILKEFRPRFMELSLAQRMELAQNLVRESIGELSHTGLHILALSVKELSPDHFMILSSLFDHFSSWSHVDHLCLESIRPLLFKYREETLALLAEWNLSPNKWKRRASVVAFVRKVAKSGEFTSGALQMCENLVFDREDIVQKGVGWALKDNLRSAPALVLPYIKELRRRGVSSTITLYAIRDLRGAEREEILHIK